MKMEGISVPWDNDSRYTPTYMLPAVVHADSSPHRSEIVVNVEQATVKNESALNPQTTLRPYHNN
jgi:pentose-5-phosphate-3-epimerase